MAIDTHPTPLQLPNMQLPQMDPSPTAATTAASTPERINLSDMDSSRYAAFGSIFILGVDSCLFPLDTIKTLIMSQREATFGREPNILRLIWRIAKTEGIARFWRGLPPAVVGSFPGQAMYYLAYETAQDVCAQSMAKETLEKSVFLRGFIAGACAEISAGLFYVPADVVAQRLQVQNLNGFNHNSRLYAGPIDLAKRIMRSEGLRGFYRGYLAYIGAYAPASAVQWGSYEHSKPLLHGVLAAIERKRSIRIPNRDHIVNGISGGFAGLCAVCANNPFEILRIRHQLLDRSCPADAEVIRRGYWYLAKSIYLKEGLAGFYKGLRLRLLVTVPGAMVAMSGYETIKTWSSQ
ncbi:uncharacterized protein SPPG_02099 [Spizellomyces punctatus DAOM BR117]|uniref:Mitochondrial carrier protein n=1 Tax=Spizellomyces punctatus (strain DAOM BR117) TaxID=645134 RepID=A0A0L0HQE7_SPIPD|nr:uncharacterized protein SPPG_02099 [Spizellomyces punctatus DAOM BR117]KND03029.1 hypothetical protein SPPG_02099 [Spizellomyces punctatus DAOM BR117]|eukprot:XP_016611068.1 hypothetical protein SPPG_02099 [Spizellomyces punctatus DAOM BR117]